MDKLKITLLKIQFEIRAIFGCTVILHFPVPRLKIIGQITEDNVFNKLAMLLIVCVSTATNGKNDTWFVHK